ncbi:MAG: hypothetical protein J5606_00945 [Bacteroidales bacterium]|nr:hypothetical protein [Bacteroidales bacterium]
MKKLLYNLSVVLLIAGMTTMTSCKKPEKLIIGKWKVTSANKNDENAKGNTWTFKDNGKFVGDIYDLAEDDWVLNNNGDEIECDYSCDGKTLTLSGIKYRSNGGKDIHGTYTFEFDIEGISNKTMSLSGKVKADGYEEEHHDTYTDPLEYELEKIK